MFDKIVTKEEKKFNSLEKEIYKEVCMLGCNILKSILEEKDKELMKTRDKRKYRHKGIRKTCIKTIMGEVEYERTIYEVEEEGIRKYVYLLDEEMHIETIGKISSNLVEKILEVAVNETSYRKGEETIKEITNETISHEGIRDIVQKAGEKIEDKEKEEVKMYKDKKLIKGTKEIPVLFEEADGLWINLQGKDRKEQIEKYKKKCKKEEKEYKEPKKVKSELKLHVTYEGWEKGNTRHRLVNKSYIAGIIPSKELKEIRDAKMYQKYNEDKIRVRVMNGDGAKWINKMIVKGTISQKDNFHIHQEIVRDIEEEKYRKELIEIILEKKYDEVYGYIENLKYELGGEERIIKKLKKLQSYLKEGLPRYQDILKEKGIEMPEAPEGIEYRNPGIMESQIFTVLKVRLGSGRKSFSRKGATYLSKICAQKVQDNKINLEKIEAPIKVDNSIEEWIKELEEKAKKNLGIHRADEKERGKNDVPKHLIVDKEFSKLVMKTKEFTEMKCSF